MTKELELTSDGSRRFCLQLLNLYATGYVTWDAIEYAASYVVKASPENVTWGAAKNAAGSAAWYSIINSVGNSIEHSVWWGVWNTTRDVVKNVANKGGTPQEIAYASCRSVILDRKTIFKKIDDLHNIVPFTPMTTKKVFDVCMTVMTFDEKEFEKLQLTIPLKMVDYLLGYRRMISFLQYRDQPSYFCLMEKHSQLTRRLGLEDFYTQLTTPLDIVTLPRYLQMLPVVLVKIVLESCALDPSDAKDSDEIYNRLLPSKPSFLSKLQTSIGNVFKTLKFY